MPKIDPKSLHVTGAHKGRKSVYGVGGSREDQLVTCPDCGHVADVLFGDHGQQCLDDVPVANPRTALGLIRKAALANGHVDANLVRSDMDAAGVPGPSRGPAFAAAVRREWIEPDGYQPSTEAQTKKHPIATYKSLIFRPRVAAEHAREATA